MEENNCEWNYWQRINLQNAQAAPGVYRHQKTGRKPKQTFLQRRHKQVKKRCSTLLIIREKHIMLPSIFPSIRVFSNELVLHIRCPKYWSFSISTFNEYSGLISFRIDWFHLAAQGTLKSFLQHHSSKASILWRSAFFMVQLSYSYMTIGRTIALTGQTFVGKVMSVLFKMLSRLVTAFLPRSKHLLISWLQS